MSYDPVTRIRSCNVCGSSDKARRYYPSPSVFYYKTQHICSTCVAGGAHWCRACQTVHARREDCPQLRLPLDV